MSIAPLHLGGRRTVLGTRMGRGAATAVSSGLFVQQFGLGGLCLVGESGGGSRSH